MSSPVSIPIKLLCFTSSAPSCSFSVTSSRFIDNASPRPCATLFLCTTETVSDVWNFFLPSLRGDSPSSLSIGPEQQGATRHSSRAYGVEMEDIPWVGVLLMASSSFDISSGKRVTPTTSNTETEEEYKATVQRIRQECVDHQVVLFLWEGVTLPPVSAFPFGGEEGCGIKKEEEERTKAKTFSVVTLPHDQPIVPSLSNPEKTMEVMKKTTPGTNAALVSHSLIPAFTLLPPLLWEHLHQLPWHRWLYHDAFLFPQYRSPSIVRGPILQKGTRLVSQDSSHHFSEKEAHQHHTDSEDGKLPPTGDRNTLSDARRPSCPTRHPLLLVVTEDDFSFSYGSHPCSDVHHHDTDVEEVQRALDASLSSTLRSSSSCDEAINKGLEYLFTYPSPLSPFSLKTAPPKFVTCCTTALQPLSTGGKDESERKRRNQKEEEEESLKKVVCPPLHQKEIDDSIVGHEVDISSSPPLVSLTLQLFNPYLYPSPRPNRRGWAEESPVTSYGSPSSTSSTRSLSTVKEKDHSSRIRRNTYGWWEFSMDEGHTEKVAEIQVLYTSVSWLPLLLDAEVPALSPRSCSRTGDLGADSNSTEGEGEGKEMSFCSLTPSAPLKVKEIVRGVITIVREQEDKEEVPPPGKVVPLFSSTAAPTSSTRSEGVLHGCTSDPTTTTTTPAAQKSSPFALWSRVASLLPCAPSSSSRGVSHLCLQLPSLKTVEKDAIKEEAAPAQYHWNKKQHTHAQESMTPSVPLPRTKPPSPLLAHEWERVEKVSLPLLPFSFSDSVATTTSTPALMRRRCRCDPRCSKDKGKRNEKNEEVQADTEVRHEERRGTVGLARFHEWLHCWWFDVQSSSSSLPRSPPPSTSTLSPSSSSVPPGTSSLGLLHGSRGASLPFHYYETVVPPKKSRFMQSPIEMAHISSRREKDEEMRNEKKEEEEERASLAPPHNRVRFFFFGSTAIEEQEWAAHVFSHAFPDAHCGTSCPVEGKPHPQNGCTTRVTHPHRKSEANEYGSLSLCKHGSTSREEWTWHTTNRYFSADVLMEVHHGSLREVPCFSSSAVEEDVKENFSLNGIQKHSMGNDRENDLSFAGVVVVTTMEYLCRAVTLLEQEKKAMPRISDVCRSKTIEGNIDPAVLAQVGEKFFSSTLSPSFVRAMRALLLPPMGSPDVFSSFSASAFSTEKTVVQCPPEVEAKNLLPPLQKTKEEEEIGTYEEDFSAAREEEETLRLLYIVDTMRSAAGGEEQEVERYLDRFISLSDGASSSSSLVAFVTRETIFKDAPLSFSFSTTANQKSSNTLPSSRPITSALFDGLQKEDTDGCPRLREAFEQHVWPTRMGKEKQKQVPPRPGEKEGKKEAIYPSMWASSSSCTLPVELERNGNPTVDTTASPLRSSCTSSVQDEHIYREGRPFDVSLPLSERGTTEKQSPRSPLRCLSCELPPHFLMHPVSQKSVPVRVLQILHDFQFQIHFEEMETSTDPLKKESQAQVVAKESTTPSSTATESNCLPLHQGAGDHQEGIKKEWKRLRTEDLPLTTLTLDQCRTMEEELLSWMREMKQNGAALPVLVRQRQAECLAIAMEQLMKLYPTSQD